MTAKRAIGRGQSSPAALRAAAGADGPWGRARALPLLGLALLAAACGQAGMTRTVSEVRGALAVSEYGVALAALRAGKQTGRYRDQDRVAYWMDEGLLLHLLRRYAESTQVLEQADRRAEELFTKSVRKELGAALTSDAARDYAGEDHERVLLSVVKALNFAALRDFDGALVEARRVNSKLQFYATQYGTQDVFQRDAFAEWLTGLLYEIGGSQDDARIAYEQAWRDYREDFAAHYGLSAPSYVGEDLVRVALRDGDADELARYRKETGASGETGALLADHGEVVLVHLNGEGPSKGDLFITCWFRSAAVWACDGEPGGELLRRTTIVVPPDGTVVKVAFPLLYLHPPAQPFVTLHVGAAAGRSQPAYPVNAIAARVMRDQLKRIFRSAIVRAIAKTLAQQAAGAAGKKAGGAELGWLAKTVASVAGQATEEADKRCWTTLPARIDVARVLVAPGPYTPTVELADGRVVSLPPVTVARGQRVVMTFHSLP
ncbi:MAG: hypothetical protein IPG96_21395 [Proteobacteria bacterium]|nr:hypothetical protein [Pseudomonadota bacterium]